MGDVAEMMLDGTLCEGCGEYMGDDVGFPRLCAGCAQDRRAAGHEVEPNGLGGFVDCGNAKRNAKVLRGINRPNPHLPDPNKTNCPICKKRVRQIGLSDHQRDAHGIVANGKTAP